MFNNQNILGYVVFDNHTLGYLFSFLGAFYIGVLGSKISKGGRHWINSPYMVIGDDMKKISMALQSDFDYFNVSSQGHFR